MTTCARVPELPSDTSSRPMQLGPAYMRLCDELAAPPDQALVPAIQLSLFAPAAGGPGAARLGGPDGLKLENDDEDGPRFGEAHLVPEGLALDVVCNDMVATLFPATCRVHVQGKEMTATQFEQYAGSGSAKKWKTSLRILPGQVAECPAGAPHLGSRLHGAALTLAPLCSAWAELGKYRYAG